MTLFEECIEALGKDAILLPISERGNLIKLLIERYPLTFYGRIDWDKVDRKFNIGTVNDIKIEMEKLGCNLDSEVYIIWDEATLPIVKTTLQQAIDSIDDVTAVSFDTWIFCQSIGYVIEFYHEGDITLGTQN